MVGRCSLELGNGSLMVALACHDGFSQVWLGAGMGSDVGTMLP